MDIYNVIGSKKVIGELLEVYALDEEFEHENEDERDVNVKLEDAEVDDFIDWCEDHSLEPTLI